MSRADLQSARVFILNERMWRNWQTRTVQVRVTTNHEGSSPSIRTSTSLAQARDFLRIGLCCVPIGDIEVDNRPIGIFDSGIGGLTSVMYLHDRLPDETVLFYGDTARAPYGSKSSDTIRKFSLDISNYLVSNGVKMLIIACNTVTAISLDAIREANPTIPVIGVIEPTAKRVAEDGDGSVGIIGTKATIMSDVYPEKIWEYDNSIRTFSLACPVLVPLIEEGIIDNKIMELAVRYYMDDFVAENDFDRLVLGCTHYPLVSDTIKRLYPQLKLYCSSAEVIPEAEKILRTNDMLAEPNEQQDRYYASDLSDNFLRMTDIMFKDRDKKIRLKKLYD